MSYKPQRIRDPLHNVIQFPGDEFHDAMWKVIQSPQFQRLRRIKQLGFSDLVYPGATHTRFAHSVGVFHTARKLVLVIKDRLDKSACNEYKETKANTALAAALVHDLGHGPYSHAFEKVGKRLNLKMAKHETVTDLLIRDSEICTVLNGYYVGFASNVADVIKKSGPSNIYGAVVSSQFDADRLDYIQRDRLMTGTHHGAIDFDWLLSNLEVGEVPYGADDEGVGKIETFVLGPKALYAAESYLLGLFQLYATVYFHKATRGAEKLFTELLVRVFELARDESSGRTGLGENHPLLDFAKNPEDLRCTLALDDSVIGGALSMMTEAEDTLISDFAKRLRDRKLFKCIDVRESLDQKLNAKKSPKSNRQKKVVPSDPNVGTMKRGDSARNEKRKFDALDIACHSAKKRLDELAKENNNEIPTILVDDVERKLYNRLEESNGPLDQIMMKPALGIGDPVDLSSISQVIKAIAPLKVLRVYIKNGDEKAKIEIDRIIEEEAKRCRY
jgi:uncharacterized protein